VQSRSKNKAWRVIKMELKQKGIAVDIIQSFEETTDKDDIKSAFALAEKRAQRLKDEPLQKKKDKLFRFLSSKGFDYDVIKEAVDKILGK
jgi:regulatory protein